MKTTIVYKKGTNFEIKGDFYSAPKRNMPVIVYIHGGGLLWGSREELKQQHLDLYHKAGFNVFSIDYRLAPETKLPLIIEDIQDALQWIETEGSEQFQLNSEKIGIVGSSAGGYLALMSGTFPKKPNAIVSLYGYGDLLGEWAIKPSRYYQSMTAVPSELAAMLVTEQMISEGPIEKRYALYMYARQQGKWVEQITGLNPEKYKAELATFCPLYNVNADYPPTLLLHGTMDEDVPYEQSLLMAETLTSTGASGRLITIPEGKHVFDDDWQNPIVQQAFQEMISFLKTHLA